MAYYTTRAERAAAELLGVHQAEWFDRIEQEHANYHAAILWWIERAQLEPALRLDAALSRYWGVRGHATEGRVILGRALSVSGHAPAAVRLEAVLSAERLTYLQADYRAASVLLDEALALAHVLGDPSSTAIILNSCGVVAMRQGNAQLAYRYYTENLPTCVALGNRRLLAFTLHNLGVLASSLGIP